MKRRILIAIYTLLPVVGLAFHYGPGQHGVALDRVQALMTEAAKASADQHPTEATQKYDEALAAVPATEKDLKAKLQVLKAECRMNNGETPEALHDLEAALTTAQQEGVSPEMLNQLRAQKSAAHYYAAYLVRLENVSEDEWQNQCDQARQGFRFLAEEAAKNGQVSASEDHQKSLENTIRLAQMDLADLKALALPKKCNGCKDATSKLCKKCDGQKPGRKPSTQKAQEKKDARNAGPGEPEEAGS